jgi:tetratricopeptide (TPR) repeat protein
MVIVVLAAFAAGALGVLAMVPAWWRTAAWRAAPCTRRQPPPRATHRPVTVAPIEFGVEHATARRASRVDHTTWTSTSSGCCSACRWRFALGWIGSRFDLRQWKRSDRQAPKAYFKGLNLLLNEQTDKAIDAFIEAVQHDPDTSELHFALGNLFRRRGEFERAVRVHQHLLQRADLPRPTVSAPSMRWRRTS